ncbi:MAG: putative methyltransferase [Alteromonadaceae bacterium]|jgi:predicted methyltransferase
MQITLKITPLMILLLGSFYLNAAPDAAIKKAVMNTTRPGVDILRDVDRKPLEVLNFFELRPGMTVLDLYATAGYYTELLSHIVGSEGKVISHNSHGYRKFVGQKINDRYLNGRLSNVQKYFNHPRDVKLQSDSLDMVLMALLYHDLYVTNATNLITAKDRQHLIRQVFLAIKPGGTLGVVDHAAPRGTGAESADKWHRISATIVTKELVDVGFEFVDESKALRNRTDPHDISIFDNKVRRKTDRFILKFRKPNS